jgi:hypothetical protein
MAILGFFALAMFVLFIHSLVSLAICRGHRLPYAVLPIAVLLQGTASISLVFESDVVNETLPNDLLFPVVIILTDMTSACFRPLFFLGVVLFLIDRQNNLKVAKNGVTENWALVFVTIHILLFFITLALGTAAPVLGFLLNDASSYLSDGAFKKQYDQFLRVTYTFDAFTYLTGIDIVVATVLLYKAQRKAGVKDKVSRSAMHYWTV